MDDAIRDVIVLGGGISGLTVAWHLKRAGVDVALVEASEQVGGCMRTEHRDGFLLEKGPFNVIVRDPAFEELLTGLADEVQVVTASKAARARFIYRKGRLMMVPTNPVALAGSPLLSLGGKARAVGGLLVSRRGGKAEYTIEDFASRRFGGEVCDTLVSAVIAGILAGDIGKLSVKACFPSLWEFDRRARSPLGCGLTMPFRRKEGGRHRRRWRGLVSIDRGLGSLADAAARTLGDRLLSGRKVEAIEAASDGYTLRCPEGQGGGGALRCRRLVLAVPAAEAGRLLSPLVPEAGTLLASIESASLTVLNLAYHAADVEHPMPGFGFLVPRNEPDFPLMGVLWADSAFPHHGKEGHRLIRVFIGGVRTPDVISWSRDRLLTTTAGALRGLLGIKGEPSLVDICPYPAAIPQYHVGHADKLERLSVVTAPLKGLRLAGNYLAGVSINDCIRLGKRVAQEVLDNQPVERVS